MSYPEQTYHDDNGEVSATFRSKSENPDLVYPSGTVIHYLATGNTTDGHFGLYRYEMAAEPSGPPAHFHKTISESFYILTGSVRIYNGEKWIDTEPGDFVHVPAGGIHAFRNESGEPASMLLHFSPGGPREGYFEGLIDLGSKTDEERSEFFLQHDNYWL
jgi:mannose-6-phosphate isomerase-like protein (cupin superfamily)